MKRILIFSTAYLPFVGGAEVAVKEITERLAEEYEFDLITARLSRTLPRSEIVGKVRVFRIGIGIPIMDKLILPFVGALKAWGLIRNNKYQAFGCIMATWASGAAYAVNMVRGVFFRKRVPLVLTLQEGDSEEHLRYRRGGLISLSWYMALKRTDMVTAISNYLLARAKAMGYKGESVLVPNGVNTRKFQVTDSNLLRAEIRGMHGFSEEDMILVTTSRLVKKNGVENVIEALQFLPENVKFMIIGTGELEESLKLKVKSLKLDDRVKFLGLISHDEIPKYLTASDVFVRPSLSEGMGNSFIEAMAAGIPIVATPVGGIVDFLRNGETGLFAEVENPPSVAKAVQKYIDDPILRDHIIENAKRMVKEMYDWDIIANRMRSVFTGAASRSDLDQ